MTTQLQWGGRRIDNEGTYWDHLRVPSQDLERQGKRVHIRDVYTVAQ